MIPNMIFTMHSQKVVGRLTLITTLLLSGLPSSIKPLVIFVTAMDSTSTMAMTSGQAALLHAQRSNLLGRFRISLEQIKPHHLQRALSKDWIIKLKDHFVEFGLDRAAYPVKVMLEDDKVVSVVYNLGVEGSEGMNIPFLPKDVPVLVYDGQHRIAACNELEGSEEKWWYALVYRRGSCSVGLSVTACANYV
jgi:hypothetical protein